jgi:hypothetical protein
LEQIQPALNCFVLRHDEFTGWHPDANIQAGELPQSVYDRQVCCRAACLLNPGKTRTNFERLCYVFWSKAWGLEAAALWMKGTW